MSEHRIETGRNGEFQYLQHDYEEHGLVITNKTGLTLIASDVESDTQAVYVTLSLEGRDELLEAAEMARDELLEKFGARPYDSTARAIGALMQAIAKAKGKGEQEV